MLVGRAVKNRKARVDEVKRFEIKHLMEVGVLRQKDTNFKGCGWHRGGKLTGSICYQIDYDVCPPCLLVILKCVRKLRKKE